MLRTLSMNAGFRPSHAQAQQQQQQQPQQQTGGSKQPRATLSGADPRLTIGKSAATAPVATLAAPQYSLPAPKADGDPKDAWELVMEGLQTLLYAANQGSFLYRPLAALLLLWECAQMLSFCLSASPVLPWRGMPVMSEIANAFQIIGFGYYIPSGTGLASAEFAIMFSLACLTVLLFFVLGIGDHPALDESRLQLRWPYIPLRWLMIGCGQCLYLPIVMQLISTFRCAPEAFFLDAATCWTSGQVALLAMSCIVLPAFLGIAALSVTTVYEHEMNSKDPYARPHGRILLMLQIVKLAVAVLFALDTAVGKWPLVIGASLGQLVALYLFIMYLPFQWQQLNQLGAAGYAVATTAGAVLILASAKDGALSSAPAWILLYTLPWAAICGFVLTSLQWFHWLLRDNAELSNVYQLELRVRRMLSEEPVTDAACEQVENLFREAMRYFPSASIIHMHVAQYMHEVRHNRHLDRSHLNALQARGGPIDETFYAYLRGRRMNEAAESEDQRAVSSRVKFEKLKSVVREQVLATRRMQTALWSELAHASPSADKSLHLASELWDNMRVCEKTFTQLLALNPNSVLVLRMYAQYMREVVSNRLKADELMEQAAEVEAIQTRAQTTEVDFIFMAVSAGQDASQDNIGLLSVSSLPTSLGIVVDANPVFCQLVGYSKRELLGVNINQIVPEPISSVHHKYLQAYQETGRGIMLNVTRTLFAVHKAGYLIPIAETMRALDHVFSAVAHPVLTSDNFVMVAMPGQKITGMCQRTLVRSHLTAKDIRHAATSAELVFPTFSEVWSQHQLCIAQYEEVALSQLDNRDTYSEQLTLPTDVQYVMPMVLAAGGTTHTVLISARLQFVKVTEAAFVVVKWRFVDSSSDVLSKQEPKALIAHALDDDEDEGDRCTVDSGSVHEESVSGSLHIDLESLSHTDQEDDGDRGLSPFHGQTAESKEMPVLDTGSTAAKGVTFHDGHSVDENQAEAAPNRSRLANARIDGVRPKSKEAPGGSSPSPAAKKDKELMVSGRSSQGSSNSSGFRSMLQRLLTRTTQVTSPTIVRLDRAVIFLLMMGAAIVIANCIFSDVTIRDANDSFQHILQVGQRLQHIGTATVRVQDIMLDTEAFVFASDDTVKQRRSELAELLDDFEANHRDLYTDAQADGPANAMYIEPNLRVQYIDGYGRIRSKLDNVLNLGVSFVSEGRLALQAPEASFTRANSHVWFLFANWDVMQATMHNFLDYYVQKAADTMRSMHSVRLYVFVAVMAGLLVLSGAVLWPMLIFIRRSREQSLAVFLDVPTPVMKAVHRQAEQWLNDAVHSQDEEDDEDLPDDDEEKQGIDSIIAALNAASRAAPEVRSFLRENTSMLKWMFKLFTPILLLSAFLIGMYFWGEGVSSSLSSFAVEIHLASELATAPTAAYYQLRRALVASNSTGLWENTAKAVSVFTEQEKLVLLGDIGQFVVDARPGLRLPEISNLFLHDGCHTQDAGCLKFYDGLFSSGLHVADQEAIRLMEQTVIEQQALLSEPGPHLFNRTAACATLRSDALHSLDVMIHEYLVDALEFAELSVFSSAGATAEAYVTGLMVVTVVAVLCILLGYLVFYRRLFRDLGAELRTGQHMLLWLPEEVLRAVPSVKAMLKQSLA